ncbi:unnamed protein product [Brugia timori]|uniref:Amidase domain-containing protein n=1 Tax=Brugia timori TaxID=42155 RepID=A0A0R3QD28_9BILA|nr:unnamed protein product [Brugia timori]
MLICAKNRTIISFGPSCGITVSEKGLPAMRSPFWKTSNSYTPSRFGMNSPLKVLPSGITGTINPLSYGGATKTCNASYTCIQSHII